MLLDVISRASSSVDTFYVYERGCENGNIRFPSPRGRKGEGLKSQANVGDGVPSYRSIYGTLFFFLNTAVYNSGQVLK